MEVSLFERLIKFGVPSVMLAEQHRMRPEVARLIVPSIYKKLVNHESVFNYPTVPSVSRSVFFLNHCNPEEKEKGASSFYNTYEVEMSLRLADFLCKQGVDEEKITILVTYGAQKEKMLSHKLYNLFSGPIHVTTTKDRKTTLSFCRWSAITRTAWSASCAHPTEFAWHYPALVMDSSFLAILKSCPVRTSKNSTKEEKEKNKKTKKALSGFT